MQELLETLLDYAQENAMKIVWGIIIAGIGWYFGRRRAQASWKKQQFLNRLNISLNMLDAGTLKIRTLSEKTCEDVFLNQHAAEVLKRYALKTTQNNPVIPIPANEVWFFLNSVLNEISEQFAQGQIRKDLGISVQEAEYLICLTREASGEINTQKIRAMMIRKSLLLNLPIEEPQYESPVHHIRWKTLQQMSQHYQHHPGDFLSVSIPS